MKPIRISQELSDLLSRAKLWAKASIPEITRRAFRKAGPDVVTVDIPATTTYGGTVVDVPMLATPKIMRTVLTWYLAQYSIPEAPAAFVTDERAGVDYIVTTEDN